jgi:hypothetical protein
MAVLLRPQHFEAMHRFCKQGARSPRNMLALAATLRLDPDQSSGGASGA